MIFYFSATGNCKYVAQKIGEAFGEKVIDIEECIQKQCYHFDAEGGRVGLITPTYYYTAPEIVVDFLKKVKIENAGYSFAVVTFFSATGYIARTLQGLFEFHSVMSVRMPDTYTPLFDLSSKEKVENTLNKAEIEIQEVIRQIQSEFRGVRTTRRFPKVFRVAIHPVYKRGKKTGKFRLEEGCIGCGLCAARCPYGAIEMRELRPVWVKEECLECLRCLHSCPKFVIQKGKNTKKHGQYTHPSV